MFVTLFAATLRSEEPKIESTSQTPAAVVQTTTNWNDKLMQLFYDKAVQYSGTAESAVGKAVEVTGEGIEKAADFVMKEAEPTFREYITWSIIKHLSDGLPWICINAIAFVAAIVSIKKTNAEIDPSPYPYGMFKNIDIWFLVACLSTIAFIISSFGVWIGYEQNALADIRDAAQAYFAPRIYFLKDASEYIQQLRH